eukprot:1161614-Amphidinium_carterae.1
MSSSRAARLRGRLFFFITSLFYRAGALFLCSSKLTGPAQSVHRAELQALITALEGSGPATLVISDCKTLRVPAVLSLSSGLVSAAGGDRTETSSLGFFPFPGWAGK